MRLSRSHLVSLILLSLSPLSLSWHSQPDPTDSYDAYSYTQSSISDDDNDDDGYRAELPSRFNTVPTSNSRPGSESWRGDSENANRVQYPYSRYGDVESEPVFGDTGIRLKCSNKKLYSSQNQIIDIQSSVQYGAQLLDGAFASSFDFCVQSCCDYEGCDLALFKVDGISKTGKTCYFVHCGLPEHCRMVSNTGFQAGFLVEQPSYGDILDNHQSVSDFLSREHENEQSSLPPATTNPVTTPPTTAVPTWPTTEATPPDTTPYMTTPYETTPSNATPPEMTVVPLTTHPATSASTHQATSASTHQATSATTEAETPEHPDSIPTSSSPHSTPEITEAPENKDNSSSAETSTGDHSNLTSPPTTQSAPIITTTNELPSSKTKGDDDEPLKTQPEHDECGKNGCGGSGLIAVSIVGTVVIIVLLAVAAVVTRRIYIIKTRKHYRNVDYLINGMYT